MYIVDLEHTPERAPAWHGLHFLGDEKEILRYKREATALTLGAMVSQDFKDERLDWILQGLASPADCLGGQESRLLLQIIAGSHDDGERLGYASHRYEAIMLAARLGHMTASQVLEELDLICETEEGAPCRNDSSQYVTTDGMVAEYSESFPFKPLIYDDHPSTMGPKAGQMADSLGLHHYGFKLDLVTSGGSVSLVTGHEYVVLGRFNGEVFEQLAEVRE